MQRRRGPPLAALLRRRHGSHQLPDEGDDQKEQEDQSKGVGWRLEDGAAQVGLADGVLGPLSWARGRVGVWGALAAPLAAP
jgi:hypothetical protein